MSSKHPPLRSKERLRFACSLCFRGIKCSIRNVYTFETKEVQNVKLFAGGQFTKLHYLMIHFIITTNDYLLNNSFSVTESRDGALTDTTNLLTVVG